MSKLPLVSSREVIRALECAGFKRGAKSPGSHQVFAKHLDDGTTQTTVMVLGKKEIPRGTLKSILERAGLSDDEFVRLLR